MRSILRDNGLSIVLFSLFLFSLVGQYISGWYDHNESQTLHGKPQVSFTGYVKESHFHEAVFENWESEFLQMAAFVIFTAFLYQKGSAESKSLDHAERKDKIKKGSRKNPAAPSPVRRGGFILFLYSYSLSIALGLLFVVSFALHAFGGLGEYNSGRTEHGLPAVGVLGYLSSSTFWFESFQNWQSEFLSIGVMVVLSIFLRHKGSPESKPVDAPHAVTGSG